MTWAYLRISSSVNLVPEARHYPLQACWWCLCISFAHTSLWGIKSPDKFSKFTRQSDRLTLHRDQAFGRAAAAWQGGSGLVGAMHRLPPGPYDARRGIARWLRMLTVYLVAHSVLICYVVPWVLSRDTKVGSAYLLLALWIILHLFLQCSESICQPTFQLLRGFANYYGITLSNFRYPAGSVGDLLARNGISQSNGKARSRVADLLILLRAEFWVPALVSSPAAVSACNLYTWPSSTLSNNNGVCYRCLLCKCDVCRPAKQWLQHVSGHEDRLSYWHRQTVLDEGAIAEVLPS